MATSLAPCPACGAAPETPLHCQECGELLELPPDPSPFGVLGVEPAFALDLPALRKRMLTLSRALHPDFHALAAPVTRRRAEDNTAALNSAYQLLSEETRRADWLVRSLGGPSEDDDRSMPAPFLQEVLEWNEAIESAREAGPGSPPRTALVPLVKTLEEARAEHLRSVASRLTPLPRTGSPVLGEVRKLLNALRYLDRALQGMRDLLAS